MVSSIVQNIFYRIIFPSILLLSCVIRPSFLSLIYGVLALSSFFFPNIRRAVEVQASTKAFLAFSLFISVLCAICQTVYQIYVAICVDANTYRHNCQESSEKLLQNFGLVKVTTDAVLDYLRILLPDYCAALTAIGTFIVVSVCRRDFNAEVYHSAPNSSEELRHNREATFNAPSNNRPVSPDINNSKLASGKASYQLKRFSDVLAVLFMFVVGTIQPSLLSAVYFIVALVLVTWWAILQPLYRRYFNRTKIFLLIYSLLHLTIIYVYQLPIVNHEIGDVASNTTKLSVSGFLGMTRLVIPWQCPNPEEITFVQNISWYKVLNPIALLFFFIFLIIQYNITKNGIGRRTDGDASSSIHEETDGANEHLAAINSSNNGDPVFELQPTGLGSLGKRPLLRNEEQPSSPNDGGTPQGDHPDQPRQSRAPIGSTDRNRVQRLRSRTCVTQIEMTMAKTIFDSFHFLIYHCYALALVTMMLWAIFFHSWLSFTWLILACGLWCMKQTRKWTLKTSPLMVVYAQILLIIEYLYAIEGLMPELSNHTLSIQIGLYVDYEYACLQLWAKFVLAYPFFMTLRMYLREKYGREPTLHSGAPTRGHQYGTFVAIDGAPPPDDAPPPDNEALGPPKITGTWFGDFLIKYWIFVVSFTLLFAAIFMQVSMFSIIYWFFFGALVGILVLSFSLFRMVLFLYWTIVIIYSSCVLIAIYLFNFEDVPNWFERVTGFSSATLSDIGLEQTSSGQLLLKLIGPIAFFFVAIMQLKFFHTHWLNATSLERANQESVTMQHVESLRRVAREEAGTQANVEKSRPEIMKRSFTLGYLWTISVEALNIVYLFLELHMLKIVALAMMIVAAHETTAINFVLVLSISLLLLLPALECLFIVSMSAYVTIVVAAKMFFQLNISEQFDVLGFSKEPNCSDTSLNATHLHSTFEWFGLDKLNANSSYPSGHRGESLSYYIQGYIVILCFIAFMAIVRERQCYKRVATGKSSKLQVLFPEIDRKAADCGIEQAIKYLCNYAFYKFGVEICYIMILITAAGRMDAVSLFYAIFLLIFVLLPSRASVGRFWYIFLIFLAISLPLQYASAVGFPPQLCIAYPWLVQTMCDNTDQAICYPNIVMYCYLPDYGKYAPKSILLIFDFFLLLFVSRQRRVFSIETENHPAGSNNSIFDKGPPKISDNPVHDFMSEKRTSLDFFKDGLFMYGHWVVIVMVFVAGLGGQSLFALGYLVAAFAFLWKGNDLYVNKMRVVRLQWRVLVCYNVGVVVCKIALQFAACGFVNRITGGANDGANDELTQVSVLCVAAQLFAISCVNQNSAATGASTSSICQLRASEALITYDLICFIFLMWQVRSLQSWYFQHVIVEYRAQRLLSSRGAVLINQLIRKKMREQQEQEVKVYESINKRVQAIQERYENTAATNSKVIFEPQSYAEAKRAGDYYMFDYEPEDEDRDNELYDRMEAEARGQKQVNKPSTSKDGFDPATTRATLSPGQVINTAIEHDLDFEKAAERFEATKYLPVDERALAAVQGSEDTQLPSSLEEEKKPIVAKIIGILQFALNFCESILDSIAVFFNKVSRDYRYVAHVLKKEKQKLKKSMGDQLYDTGGPQGFRDFKSMLANGEVAKDLQCVTSEKDVEIMENEAYKEWSEKNSIGRFFTALGYVLISRTEELCYIFMILDNANTATLLSVPLPLFAFFWGTLCTPRPPKSFWIVVIAYTQAIIVIKFMFQFSFWPWNVTKTLNPDEAVNIIGIDQRSQFANWDVVLLIALFFHRYVLRSMGLWKDAQRASAIEEARIEQDEQQHLAANESTQRGHQRQASAVSRGTVASMTPLHQQTSMGAKHSAYFGGVLKFFHNVLHPNVHYFRDLYPYMFFCDIICLLVATFGYSAFGVDAGSGSVISDIQTSRIPVMFVLLVVILTILIIIDRAIYLRKSVVIKLIFQYILVLGVHIWIFFILPLTTYKLTRANKTAKVWYFVKCIYFLFSAWQIRNGYPKSSIGHLIMRSYNIVSMVFFKIFMLAPFIFELRSLIDWTWTDTSFPLFDYLNMENNFATIYGLKCMRKFEQDYPAPRGKAKSHYIKYLMGIPIIVFIVLLIFGPLLAYSLVNHIGTQALPKIADFSLEIEGYPKLYSMQARATLDAFTPTMYNSFLEIFPPGDRAVASFFEEYANTDVQRIQFSSSSTSDWEISSPARKNLLRQLTSTEDLYLLAQLKLTRASLSKTEAPLEHNIQWRMKLKAGEKSRNDLAKIVYHSINFNASALNSTLLGTTVVKRFITPYLLVPNRGEANEAYTLTNALDSSINKKCEKFYNTHDGLHLDLTLELQYDTGNKLDFWKIYFNDTDNILTDCVYSMAVLDDIPSGGPLGLVWVAFIDKTFPGLFSSIVSSGVIAMYTAVVLVVSRLVRGLVTSHPTEVIIQEMPCVDRLLKMCKDIYIVRECRNFTLEQDLFARLIFLFRSPETLIKWTRPKIKAD